MLPESWITDKCPEVLDYLNKKYNLKLSGCFCYYGETKQDKYFAGDSRYKEYTYLTKEQFLEMIQEKEVWKKGGVLYSDVEKSYRKIFNVFDNIIFTSMSSHHYDSFSLEKFKDPIIIFRKESLESNGYKLYKPKEKEEKIVELTLEEIAEKFDVDIKSLKIKK